MFARKAEAYPSRAPALRANIRLAKKTLHDSTVQPSASAASVKEKKSFKQ